MTIYETDDQNTDGSTRKSSWEDWLSRGSGWGSGTKSPFGSSPNPWSWTPPSTGNDGGPKSWLTDGFSGLFDNDPDPDPSDELSDRLLEAIDELINATDQGYEIDWSGDYPVVIDADGNVIQDFSQYGEQLDALKNIDIPSLNEYAQQNGLDLTGANEDMQDIIGMFTDPAQQEADEQAAMDYFHQLAGIDDPEYMSNLLAELDAGMDAQPGLSEAEREAYQQATDRQVQQLERTGDRQIDAVMGSYGSQMRGLAAAEQVRQQVGDARVQGELTIVQEDQARRQYNYEAKRDRYNSLLQAGQITQQQYMDGLRADRMSALQGYASQIDSMTRSYGAEIEGIRAHADIMYNTLMADMGINQAAIDFGNSWYQSQLAPFLTQIQAITTGMTSLNNQDMQEYLSDLMDEGEDSGGEEAPWWKFWA